MDIHKALVVYRVDRNGPSNQGVLNKLIGQVHGLEELGTDVDYITHAGHKVFFNQEVIVKTSSWMPNMWFKFQFWNYLPKGLQSYDLIIIRYTLLVPSFITWLRHVRKNLPQCKIIIDMPTYPYNKEWKGWKKVIGLKIDKFLQKNLSSAIDYILHSGLEKYIFNIPTIPFSNGVDVDRIPLRRTDTTTQGLFTMIAVGKWQFWHGLDRIIKGIKTYHGPVVVELLVIGDGPEIIKLKDLSVKCDVEDQVHFMGSKSGRQLDHHFDRAHLGIGTLGLHRKNVTNDSSLKHRAYCARGLPFVLSSPDVGFSPELSFVNYVDIDDSNIDIEKLIEFVNRLDQKKAALEMRKYAETNLTWVKKMKILLEQL